MSAPSSKRWAVLYLQENSRVNCEPFRSAGFRLGRLFFTIFSRGRGFQRTQKAVRHGGYFVDGGNKGCLVGLRGFIKAGDFADKLERSRAHFFVGDRRIEVKKREDDPTENRCDILTPAT